MAVHEISPVDTNSVAARPTDSDHRMGVLRDPAVDLVVAHAISLAIRDLNGPDAYRQLAEMAGNDPELLQTAADRCLVNTVVEPRTVRRAARLIQRARASLPSDLLRPSA